MGYGVSHLQRAELAALEPAIADLPDEALMFADEGVAEAGQLTHDVLDAACATGLVQMICGAPVLRLLVRGGDMRGVALEGGELPARKVVVAAGVQTQGLLAGLDVHLPMLRRPGVLLMTQALPRVINHILVGPLGEIRQTRSGQIVSPCALAHQGDTTRDLSEPPLELARQALARLQRVLPGTALKIDRVISALRPMPQDGLPALGAIGPNGLFVASLHSGVSLAPMVGDLLAQEILGTPQDQWLAPYRPQRFSDTA